jgi:hypothetical protein
MLRTRRARWIAVGLVYGLALAFLGALIAGESDASTHRKVGEAVVFVVAPALVFLLAAVPLWRESPNRLWLSAAGLVSFLSAIVIAVVTWGVGLPVSAGLVAVAIADFDRALALSSVRGGKRGIALAVALVIAGGFVGLVFPIAVMLAVLGLAMLVWKLIATRPRRTERPS